MICHVTHHQATQQTLLLASQVVHPDNCSSVTVSLPVGMFGQLVKPQMGSGQGNENLAIWFGFCPRHMSLLWWCWSAMLRLCYPPLWFPAPSAVYPQLLSIIVPSPHTCQAADQSLVVRRLIKVWYDGHCWTRQHCGETLHSGISERIRK